MDLSDIEGRKYFTIGQLSRAADVPEHSIRYWEARYKLLNPVILNNGRRKYTRKDVEKLLKIKDLVYRKKMSLQGAKKSLSQRSSAGAGGGAFSPFVGEEVAKLLKDVSKDISDIIKEC